MTVFYISPKGSGSHNGSSVKNAATINNLSKIIAKAGAGDEVRLLADKGAYNVNKPITITDGGGSGAPITIRGVSSSGKSMKAQFVGSRSSDWKPGRAQGNELFRLKSGASNLTFTDISAKNFGNGVFRFGGNLKNIDIRRVSANNVARFIENNASGTKTASVNGLNVQDVTVSRYSKDAIRLQYNTQDVTLKNIVGDSQKQRGDNFIHGVNLRGTVHNVVLDHVTMKNHDGRSGSKDYWNGDGFLAEGGVHNLTFRDTFASGNTDGGYDLKANNVTMIRARAEGNTKNFRFWGDNVKVIDSVSVNPKKFGGTGATAHLHTGGKSATVTLDNFRYSGSGNVFDLANGGSRIKLVNMSMPDKDRIKMGSSKVQMVKGGASDTVKQTPREDVLASAAGTDASAGTNGNDTSLVDNKSDRSIERAGEASARNDRPNEKDGNDQLIGGRDSGGSDRPASGSANGEEHRGFNRSGSDLLAVLRGNGNSDSIGGKAWQSSPSNRSSGSEHGSELSTSRMQQMVQAMAEFSTKSGTPTHLTSKPEQAAEPVLASNWHNA
jgi:hypothetical protein